MQQSIIDWISLGINALGAGATLALAILVFNWTRKSERNSVTRSAQSDWRDYNLAVLADEELQRLEAENHLHDGLTSLEVKKMCIYFIKLNVPYNMWIAQKSDLITNADVDREISNQAALLFDDRDFIKKHIFPRGYDDAFCDLFHAKWKTREGQQAIEPKEVEPTH